MYIDTASPVPYIPSKSRGLADKNLKKIDGIEMIRNKRIIFTVISISQSKFKIMFG